jgi:hypothetical protein
MRIAGHNVIAIAAAAIAFWLIGSLWFGLVFSQTWIAAQGYTEAEIAGDNPAWMGVGVLIAIVTAIGLSVVLRWGGLPDVMGAVKRALWLWLFFGLTGAAYSLAYEIEHSPTLLALLAGYLLVGWPVQAAIIARLK